MLLRHHATLMAAHAPAAADPDEVFDGHVLACILTVALAEIAEGRADPTSATGLDAAGLAALLDRRFPEVDRDAFAGAAPRAAPEMEEELLRDLLDAHARPDSQVAAWLAPMIARRAMRPDHLWQDLGLFHRAELGRLLARHFPTLHAGNTGDMRWKKYFYRKLCEAEGFSLCTAPTCSQCTDFAACFGAEDGESRMAATRRALDLALAAE